MCAICRDWKTPESTHCHNCTKNAETLGTPPVQVLALTLYTRTCPVRDVLSGYKDPNCDEREAHQVEIAALLRQLFDQLPGRLRWDAICVVPSSGTDRLHPLHRIANRITDHAGLLIAPLRRGSVQLGHGRPHPDGYATAVRLDGLRVLILDDVYTTGARSQSAAHALSRAGATITAVAVIGRRINPSATPELAEWSRRHGLTTYPTDTI